MRFTTSSISPPARCASNGAAARPAITGLRSLDAHIGDGFCRVRIGIGHPGEKERVHGHVLGDFAKADALWVDPLLAAIGEHAPLLARHDHGRFQNKVHLALNPPEKDAKPQPAENA